MPRLAAITQLTLTAYRNRLAAATIDVVQLVQTIVSSHFVALSECEEIKDIVDEKFGVAIQGHDRLTDMDQLRCTGADHMNTEQLMGVSRSRHG